MTTTTRTAPVVGQLVHFYGSTTIIPTMSWNAVSFVTRYGMELRITQEMYDASIGNDGKTWLDLAHDPDAQMRDWGKVLVGLGPWPEAELRMERGDPRWQEARGAAMREASALQDPTDQAAARRAAHKLYGPPETTSRTFIKYPDGDK